jgi:hypothetical protein
MIAEFVDLFVNLADEFFFPETEPENTTIIAGTVGEFSNAVTIQGWLVITDGPTTTKKWVTIDSGDYILRVFEKKPITASVRKIAHFIAQGHGNFEITTLSNGACLN